MKAATLSTSRRTFIKKSILATGSCALASSAGLPYQNIAKAAQKSVPDEPVLIRYNACLVNCGSRCPLKLEVISGVITKVSPEDGDPGASFGAHPITPCLRGRSVRSRIYSPDRIKYPMLRTGKRGEGKFKKISWEEATSRLAEQLKYTVEKYGNESLYYQYGSGLTGANHHGASTCRRLLNLMGGYLNQHGTYSEAQLNTIRAFMFGDINNIYGTEHQTLFSEIGNSDLVVMFGLNLAETRASGGGQTREFLEALNKSKARTIIIDPRRSDSVSAFNAQWIPINPGTDAALVAAMGYVLITENRINHTMLNRYTVGWSEETLPESAPEFSSYQAYILGQGKDRLSKTPEWASKLTGIPVQTIYQLARDIANAKAAWISQGWGPQRHQTGEHTARAIMTLPIITGHFGRPGTNIGTWGGSVPYSVPGLSIPNPVTTSIPFFLWPEAIIRGPEMRADTDFIKGKEKLEVGIKFLWNYASNVTGNQHADLNRIDKILADDSLCEFILVWDTHLTASARYADLLLPDVSNFETEDLINNSYASGAYHYAIRTKAAIEPLWESRPVYEVLSEVADKLGIKAAFTEGRTYREWIKTSYEKLREAQPHIPSFDHTDETGGVIDRKLAHGKDHIALKAFRDDPTANPLNTPSGKIELYSEALLTLTQSWILNEGDKIPAVPMYIPSIEGVESEKLKERYPLQMIGFHTKGHVHSSYSNLSGLKEAVPDEVWMNPIDAARRQLTAQMNVEIFNDRGRMIMPLKVTQRIIPGTIAVPQGAWSKTNGKNVDIGGCINRLTSSRPTAIAKGNPQHTNLVEVKQA